MHYINLKFGETFIMKVIHGSLSIFPILNFPQNLDDIAHIFILLQQNVLLLDKSLASSFDSIELKTSNANKWDFLHVINLYQY